MCKAPGNPASPQLQMNFLELATSSNGLCQTKNGSHVYRNGNGEGIAIDVDPSLDRRPNNDAPVMPINNNVAHVTQNPPLHSDEDLRLHTASDPLPFPGRPRIEERAKLLAKIRDLEQRLESTIRQHCEAQHRKAEEPVDRPESPETESSASQTNVRNSQWNNEIKRWKRVTSRHGSTEIYKASEKVEDVRARSSGYVLTVYDEYDHEGNRTHVSLEINSAPLLELLRKVIFYYPGDEFDTLRGLE